MQIPSHKHGAFSSGFQSKSWLQRSVTHDWWTQEVKDEEPTNDKLNTPGRILDFFFNSNNFMENLCWLERIMNKLRDKFWVIHRSSFFKYGGRGDCLGDTWLVAAAGFTVIGTWEWTAVAGVVLDTRTQDWWLLLRKSRELCCLFC